jgi:hypothetical protein
VPVDADGDRRPFPLVGEAVALARERLDAVTAGGGGRRFFRFERRGLIRMCNISLYRGILIRRCYTFSRRRLSPSCHFQGATVEYKSRSIRPFSFPGSPAPSAPCGEAESLRSMTGFRQQQPRMGVLRDVLALGLRRRLNAALRRDQPPIRNVPSNLKALVSNVTGSPESGLRMRTRLSRSLIRKGNARSTLRSFTLCEHRPSLSWATRMED